VIPHKYATIMSGLVVRWRFAPKHGDVRCEAEINASRDGVSICGAWPIMSGITLAKVLKTLEAAFDVHERLKEGDELPEIPSAPWPEPEPLNEPISRQARERDLDDE
jgi:hypothetical protein